VEVRRGAGHVAQDRNLEHVAVAVHLGHLVATGVVGRALSVRAVTTFAIPVRLKNGPFLNHFVSPPSAHTFILPRWFPWSQHEARRLIDQPILETPVPRQTFNAIDETRLSKTNQTVVTPRHVLRPFGDRCQSGRERNRISAARPAG
jgi:hypothetical protein